MIFQIDTLKIENGYQRMSLGDCVYVSPDGSFTSHHIPLCPYGKVVRINNDVTGESVDVQWETSPYMYMNKKIQDINNTGIGTPVISEIQDKIDILTSKTQNVIPDIMDLERQIDMIKQRLANIETVAQPVMKECIDKIFAQKFNDMMVRDGKYKKVECVADGLNGFERGVEYYMTKEIEDKYIVIDMYGKEVIHDSSDFSVKIETTEDVEAIKSPFNDAEDIPF